MVVHAWSTEAEATKQGNVISHRGVCSCGWRGRTHEPTRKGQLGAGVDAVDHVRGWMGRPLLSSENRERDEAEARAQMSKAGRR